MDDPAVNKNHMPCPVWPGQVNWCGDPTQGAPLIPLSTTQQLGLGSSTDSRPNIYDQIQVSGLNCLNNLPCRVNSQTASLFKTTQICSTATSASFFANTPASTTASNVLSFAQLSQTPLMQTTDHSKNATSPSYQTTQHMASFQPLLPNQGLTRVPPELPVSLPSCSQGPEQHILSKSTDSDFVDGHNMNNPTIHLSPCRQNRRGNKEKSSDSQAPQIINTVSLATAESRNALIQQREELLKKLSDLDALLKTLPSERIQTEEASRAADGTPVPSDAASQKAHDDSSDFSECTDVISGDEESPGYEPITEDVISDSTDNSSSEEPSEKKSRPNTRSKKNSKRLSGTKSKQKRTLNGRYTPKSSVLVLQCVSKKGKRVYDKKNYCLFCSKPFSKLSRHLEMVHGHQEEVAVALKHPKHSKERQNIWNRLKNKGNFAHNKKVLKTGKGFLAAVKRPKIPVQNYEFVHCLYCQGLYISKGLSRHMKKCPEKIKEDEPKIGKRRLAFRCVLETVVPDISEGFKGLISPMINDPVTQAILNHKVIIQFGESMFKQQGADPNRHENIRQNLRQITRLVLEAQKQTPLKEMEDFFVPDNFKHVISAVNIVAGYNSESNSYSSPSLAIKLGYQLQKLCSIVESNAIKSGDESKAKSAQGFLEMYKNKWNKLVSASALTTLRESKRVKEESVPSIQDVKCLNSFVANAHTVAENLFREHVSAETYASLAKVLLSRVILFNRRKPGEVSSLKLGDFLSRKMYDTYNYSGIPLSDLERTMCRFFSRIEIRGNCGRIVPVLLKQSFVFGLELLVKNREACGVPAENPFLFARPTARTSYSGSTILQSYVKDCGAASPKTLTTAKIRMHYAAMLQMLNLDENEANQILGPNYLDLQSTQDSQVIDPQAAFEDIESQTAVEWDQNSFTYNRPAAYYPEQSHHAQTPVLAAAPKRQVTDKPQRVSPKNSKQKWDEAEIHAVERHMMRFIHGHKVPQKADCLQCLDAEAEALRARSWKGLKDFVRNRITALKREESRSALKNLPPTNWTSQDSGYYQF